ncbi:MAG: Gfo/Idh/MocA family oxidoreductase [Polyangiales bacterium]
MTLRVGVVGYGYWGPNIVRNFGALGGEAKVTWVCDSSPARLERARSVVPNAHLTARFEDLLEASDCDAIAIITPVATHHRLALATLNAGKHAFVTKPMTRTVEESRELCALASSQKLTLFVDHTFVYHGAVKRAKEIIDRGELGELWYFDSVRINLGLFQRDVNVLWDLAPHDLAILDHWCAQEPVAVSAVGAAHGGQPHADVAYLTVHYNSSFIAHVHANWLSPTKVRQIILGGNKKMLIYDDMEVSEKIKVYDRGIDVKSDEEFYNALVQYRMGDMWAPRLEMPEALLVELRHFVRCCVGHETPLTGGAAGLRVVQILEAASKSISLGGAPVPCVKR